MSDNPIAHSAESDAAVEPLQECERCRVRCSPGMACVSSVPGHVNAERPCRDQRPATTVRAHPEPPTRVTPPDESRPYPTCLPSLGETCGSCHRCTPHPLRERA